MGRTGCAARCFRSAVRCGLERVAGSVLKREERFFSESADLGVTAPGTAPSLDAHAVIAHRSLPAVALSAGSGGTNKCTNWGGTSRVRVKMGQRVKENRGVNGLKNEN